MAKWNTGRLLFVICFLVTTMTECKAFSLSELDIHALYKEISEVLTEAPEILPDSFHLELHDTSQLEDGDVLVTHSLWKWNTYAIVSNARERKVICFATRDRHPVPDLEAYLSMADIRLREVGFSEVPGLKHGVVEVARQQNQEKKQKIVEKAKAKVGESFSLYSFNSEHFVTLAVTGKAQSPQIENPLSVVKKVLWASLETPEGREAVEKLVKYCAEKGTMVAEKTVDIVLKLAERFVGSMDKETKANLISALQMMVKKEMKLFFPALSKTVEFVVKRTEGVSTISKLIGGNNAVVGGVVMEGVSLLYTGISSYYKMNQGEISGTEFRQHMVKSIGASGFSVVGNGIGGAIGSMILPGWGTFVGGVLGGIAGNYLGTWSGEQFDELVFDQN